MRKRRQPKSSAKSPVSDLSSQATLHDAKLLRLQFCFFLSGAAGLVYQVVWTKLLSQLFGSTTYAVAAVLAVFMGGLALGNALFARWRPGNHNGAALYALMEFAIAATSALSLIGIPVVRKIYLAGYPYFGNSIALLLALRFLGAAIVLLLPTVLMGGTFPVLVGAVTRKARELGTRAGRFYAVNTAGAVAGIVAAGFWLIPGLGLRMTVLCAAASNVIAGLLARKVPSSETPPGDLPQADPAGRIIGLYLVCFAGVGATAIAYEIAWTRLLATPLGSSTYAFSLMLATFLLGLAIGSLLFERWYREKRQASVGLFAATQLAIAAAAMASLWFYGEIPELFLAMLRKFGNDFAGLLAAQAATCAAALLPVTILFGFNFPAVLALLSPVDGSVGIKLSARIGRAMAANTFGAIAAAVIGGFVLLPRLGSSRLLLIAAFCNIAIAGVLLFVSRQRNWKALALAGVLGALTIVLGVWPAFFSQASAAYGVLLYRNFHRPSLTAREMAETEDLLFFKDGVNATIAVTRSENYLALKTNGKVDASNLDKGTQLLLGDLGAVFHSNPRRVLVIGFGGGMTVSAVSRFPEVERIDCVEIEPAVLQAASRLERLNRGVLRDPRLHIHFDDARNFLQATRERFDLIISEPSNPWIAGIASLYTSEFFEVVRDHLAPGGNLVQWVQAYGLSADSFSMILASMAPKFQDVTLWRSAENDFLVLARQSREAFRLERARRLWQNGPLREDFQELKLERSESWPAFFRLNDREIRLLAARSPVNTDDKESLEYRAPRQFLRESAEELDRLVAAFEQATFAEVFPYDSGPEAVIASAATALEVNPRRALKLIDFVPSTYQSSDFALLRARALLSSNAASAIQALTQLGQESGTNQPRAKYWLAVNQRDHGLYPEAQATLSDALRLNPNDPATLQLAIELASHRDDWIPAIEYASRLVSVEPSSAENRCRLGDLYLRAKELDLASASLRKGLEIDPYMYFCHRDLGELHRATGRISEAISELEWVVRYFPEADPLTYASLALAYGSRNEGAKASEVLKKGLRIFPQDSMLRGMRLKR